MFEYNLVHVVYRRMIDEVIVIYLFIEQLDPFGVILWRFGPRAAVR